MTISFDLKDLKSDLLNLLYEKGIPEFNITVKEYKNNKKGFLGAYSSMSQFRSKPLIRLDVQVHTETLHEMGEYTDYNLKKHVMETLAHEYGHVVEEFIKFDANQNKDKTVLNKLNSVFEDMEDFAEIFGKWVNNNDRMDSFELQVMQEIVEHYVNNVFLPESIAWVRQDKWKRELDYFLDSNEKSLTKYATAEGSFNKCTQVSEAIAQRMCKITDMDIKVVRFEGYKGDTSNIFPKWKRIPAINMVHYAILLDNQYVVDLTAKQFDSNADARQITHIDDINKTWNEMTVHQDYTIKKQNTKLKM